MTESMAELENQPVPVLSALVCKEKHWKLKWMHLVRDEGAASKRDQETDYSKTGLSQEKDKEDR